MNRRPTAVLTTAVAPVAWGTTYLVTSELLPADRPLWSGAVRALPAGLLLLALTRRLPPGSWWWRALVLGALNIGAFFPLLFLAAYRLPGGTAAVLGATGPLLVAGLTVLLLGERPRPRALAAAVTALAGVTLVVLRPDGTAPAGPDPVGVAAGLSAAAAMAAGLVLARRWGRPPGVGTLATTAWQLTAGGLLVSPLAWAVEGPPPAPDLPAATGYAWLTLAGTALAYALWFRGAARLPVTQVSLLGALSPLTAALLGWAVLGQGLTGWQLAGFAVAVGATVLGQLPPRTGRRPHPTAGPGLVSPAQPGRTDAPSADPTPANPGPATRWPVTQWPGNLRPVSPGPAIPTPANPGPATLAAGDPGPVRRRRRVEA
ncbi:probable blue pigment (indigoidine) exporter [Micromonospora nigra]|uniref:Probable blue pigment (Indigoidine) exporter n=1 Tax=Micromonospora nigra TaxID=145857 RepID=A0A1C6RQK9_9ACTN|nr:EamA family transporter [Micromonospora nigra]SCL19347.1 probable blue pigment (indigoidine) exporter [Micromonospora nigra]